MSFKTKHYITFSNTSKTGMFSNYISIKNCTNYVSLKTAHNFLLLAFSNNTSQFCDKVLVISLFLWKYHWNVFMICLCLLIHAFYLKIYWNWSTFLFQTFRIIRCSNWCRSSVRIILALDQLITFVLRAIFSKIDKNLLAIRKEEY